MPPPIAKIDITRNRLGISCGGCDEEGDFGATLAGASLAAGTATAADLPRGPTPYYANPAPVGYNWMGAYVGANVGYEWGKISNTAIEPNGFLGGLQAGYNWQTGQFVLGAETDHPGDRR